jgi:hypothetical protein
VKKQFLWGNLLHTGHFNTHLMTNLPETDSPIKTAFSPLDIFKFQDDDLLYNFSPGRNTPFWKFDSFSKSSRIVHIAHRWHQFFFDIQNNHQD